ncbi:condensation domain-containing protein [Tumebacillus lipolyticus]|uniref:Condensation domain-containing protein n=1 Tax=Tumebacillus lipolyticus TaxID=1280370 RepID=A0ABW4ZUP2_9BACL
MNDRKERSHHLFTLSARSRQAVRQAAGKLLTHLKVEPDQSLGDLAYTLHVGREPFDHRLALIAESRAELKELCRQAMAAGDVETVREGRQKIVFLFSGQGSQFVGMGQTFYETSAVFRQACEDCFAIVDRLYPLPFREYLFNPAHRAALDEVQISPVAMFIIEYALSQLWMSWGIRPDCVFGHSLGEYVAACIAGGLSLQDALLIVSKRGALIQEGVESAGMIAISASPERVQFYLDQFPTDLSLAIVNSPQQVVLGGRREAIESLDARLTQDGVVHRLLPISTAYHTVLTESILEPFTRFMQETITFFPLRLPLLSNLSGELMQEVTLDADYWCRHLRETVQFGKGVERILQEGNAIFLEIGPHPVLTALIESQAQDEKVLAVPSLSRKEHAWKTIQASIGRLWERGVEIDWHAFDREWQRRRVHGPTYAFDLSSCWVEQNEPVKQVKRELPTSMLPVQPATVQAEAMTQTQTTEERMRAIWREVLGIGEFAADDNFLTLGGESLNMIQVQSRLNRAFRLRLQLSDLYAHAVFGAQVAFVEERMREATESISSGKKVRQIAGEVPLSHIQRWLFDSKMNPEFYFLPIVIEKQNIKAELLLQALQLLHEHHEMLRATYHSEAGQIKQILLPAEKAKVELHRFDLSDMRETSAQEAEYDRVELELAKGIKFGEELMNRAALFDLGAGRHRVLWIVSHLYSDSVSGAILMQDLIETYERLAEGERAIFDESGSSYREWVASCHHLINSEQGEGVARFWEPFLEKIEAGRVEFETADGQRSTNADMSIRLIKVQAADTDRLRTNVPAELGVTIKEVLTGVVARVLSSWLSREQVCFAINGHGRDELGQDRPLDLSRTVGYFINTYPFCLQVVAREPIERTILNARRLLQSLPHGGASFNMLRYLSDDRSVREQMGSYRDPQILFNYQGELRDATDIDTAWRAGRAGHLEQPMEQEAQYKLNLVGAVQGGELTLQVHYCTRQFEQAQIDRLEEIFAEEVQNVLATSQQALK